MESKKLKENKKLMAFVRGDEEIKLLRRCFK